MDNTAKKPIFASMNMLTSQVALVTVFPNRAQITRTATIDLPAGEHWLVFDNLPASIDQKSVQVNGAGKAIITKVQFQQVFPEPPSDTQYKALQARKIAQETNIRILQEKTRRLEKQKVFLDDIAKKVTNPNKQADILEFNPTSWLEMLTFYQTNLAETDHQLLETELEKRKEDEILAKINWEVQHISSQTATRTNQVVVGLEVREAGAISLALAYMVHHASWQPIYDLRVSTETKQMQVNYKAIVQQQTGENWDNTELRLSTAQPAISGQQPELSPWRIQLHDTKHRDVNRSQSIQLGGARQMFNAPVSAMSNMFQHTQQETNEESSDGWMGAVVDEIDIITAVVETKATAVFFNIAGKHIVKSDTTDHQVTIMQTDFAAHFRYSAVPKLSTFAYLKIKVKNETAFPFLAGETNIFLDNNFVANARMNAVAPTEEFWTFLGIDEGIKIEYKFLKKYEKKEGGMFTKKIQTWLYEYLIMVKNHKQTEEEIVIWDQLPISGNEQLKIHLIEPTYKENTDRLKKNEMEYLEWFFIAKPNEEIQIPFKFSVEHPQDMYVQGL